MHSAGPILPLQHKAAAREAQKTGFVNDPPKHTCQATCMTRSNCCKPDGTACVVSDEAKQHETVQSIDVDVPVREHLGQNNISSWSKRSVPGLLKASQVFGCKMHSPATTANLTNSAVRKVSVSLGGMT